MIDFRCFWSKCRDNDCAKLIALRAHFTISFCCFLPSISHFCFTSFIFWTFIEKRSFSRDDSRDGTVTVTLTREMMKKQQIAFVADCFSCDNLHILGIYATSELIENVKRMSHGKKWNYRDCIKWADRLVEKNWAQYLLLLNTFYYHIHQMCN